jgi:hypothetical protein
MKSNKTIANKTTTAKAATAATKAKTQVKAKALTKAIAAMVCVSLNAEATLSDNTDSRNIKVIALAFKVADSGTFKDRQEAHASFKAIYGEEVAKLRRFQLPANFKSMSAADKARTKTAIADSVKDYAKQCLARMLTLAFGGASLTEKQRTVQLLNLRQAVAANTCTLAELIAIATGRLRYDVRKKELIELETGAGPKNAKPVKNKLAAGMTRIQAEFKTLKAARYDTQQVFNGIVSLLIELKFIKDAADLKDLI